MALKDAHKDEANIARKLVKLALERGYSVSVNDGEEWTLHHSRKLQTILDAMATTDCDVLQLTEYPNPRGDIVGWVWLVWGNGEDLISDITDTEAMEEFCEELDRKIRTNY